MSIPFDVPASFLAGLSDGSLIRYGTLLKDSSSGQIVAHLQETGLASKLMEGLPNLALAPHQVVNTGFLVDQSIQLRQLTSLVETLRTLQYATMGIALVGIGVSAAGFALMHRRLKNLEGEVANLKTTVERLFKELRWDQLRPRFASAATSLERAENARSYRNPDPELLGAANQLAESSGFFKAEVENVLQQEHVSLRLLQSLTHVLMLCDTTRVDCLVEANEMSAAVRVAERIESDYSHLFEPLDSGSLVRRIAKSSGAYNRRNHSELRELRLNHVQPLLQMLREATDAATTRPLLIENLTNNGVDGAAYLKQVRNEEKEPILLLRISTRA